ncbi:MAG TPA: hypothetical protein VGM78_04290, partial [Ilumatobacteraceae bacterium]
WLLIITPILPNNRDASGASVLDTYRATFSALAIVLVLGVFVWELIYHFLQQFRWEKDWPVMFTFFEVINEAWLAYFVFDKLHIGRHTHFAASNGTFWWGIVTTWIVMWLFVLGPIKVVFVRWRFSGGRIFF